MTFEEMYEEMIGVKPAEINARIIDVTGNSEIELSGRKIDLITLSIQIARNVIEKSDTDVDVYCQTLKKASNNFRDDLKPDEQSKEESKTITKEDFKKAWTKTVANLIHDKDLDDTQLLLSSLIFTKCANEMCESLFGEGLNDK